jgi:hypothetical protein
MEFDDVIALVVAHTSSSSSSSSVVLDGLTLAALACVDRFCRDHVVRWDIISAGYRPDASRPTPPDVRWITHRNRREPCRYCGTETEHRDPFTGQPGCSPPPRCRECTKLIGATRAWSMYRLSHEDLCPLPRLPVYIRAASRHHGCYDVRQLVALALVKHGGKVGLTQVMAPRRSQARKDRRLFVEQLGLTPRQHHVMWRWCLEEFIRGGKGGRRCIREAVCVCKDFLLQLDALQVQDPRVRQLVQDRISSYASGDATVAQLVERLQRTYDG